MHHIVGRAKTVNIIIIFIVLRQSTVQRHESSYNTPKC